MIKKKEQGPYLVLGWAFHNSVDDYLALVKRAGEKYVEDLGIRGGQEA